MQQSKVRRVQKAGGGSLKTVVRTGLSEKVEIKNRPEAA